MEFVRSERNIDGDGHYDISSFVAGFFMIYFIWIWEHLQSLIKLMLH